MSDIRVGVCSITWKEQLDIFRVLEVASRIGFDGVEIWGQPPHVPAEYDEDHLERLKAALDEKGLAVSMYGSYLRATDPDFGEQADLAIRITRSLGTNICRIWAGDVDSADADEAKWEVVVRDLQELCAKGRDHGLLFAMERHGHTLTDEVPAALRLMEKVGADNLVVNYQIGRYTDADTVAEEIRKLGSKTVNVHAWNATFSDEGRSATGLAEGDIDYQQVVNELKAVNMTGFIEVEFVNRGTGGPLELAEKEAELEKDYRFLRNITSS